MRLRVLGSSAGGGFPQWNCNCNNCKGLRRGTLRARARTQSSIAVSADDVHWLLVNASPDLLQQVKESPCLQPARHIRDSGIAAVLVVDAQIDHVTGLLMLRERRSPLPLLATSEVFDDLSSGFPIVDILSHFCQIKHYVLTPDGSAFEVPDVPGLSLQAVSLSSKPPPYSPFRGAPRVGDNIGLIFTHPQTSQKVFYAPGLAAVTDALLAIMSDCVAVLVDGTFWTNDEMQRLGLSDYSALDLGHLPQSGPNGMLDQLDRLPRHVRRILIHINNTNPILNEDSVERALLTRHGIEVAFDGMELTF